MTEKHNKQSKKIMTVLFIILNIVVVAYIAFSEFGNGPVTNVEPHFSKFWFIYISGAILCLVVLFMAETSKYVHMMRILGEKVSVRVAFETAALGKYYDCITPSGIGGQPFQIYWLHKYGYSDGASSSMPITGFITMQTGFIILASLVFITWRSVEIEVIRYTAYAGLLACLFVPVLIFAFSFKPKAIEKLIFTVLHFCEHIHLIKDSDLKAKNAVDKIKEFNTSFRLISKNRKAIVTIIFLSLIYQIAFCSISYFVLTSLGGTDSYNHVLAATVYIYATAFMVATPGNSGAAESIFYLVFSAIGSNEVFWAMILWRLLSYYSFIIIGGLIFAYHALETKFKKKCNESNEY